MFYSGNILRRIIFLNVSKSSDTERLNNICVANVSDEDFIIPVIDNQFKCSFIFVNMPHRIHKCTNTLCNYVVINY
jgi:hypothetical protein